ncbi:hypothetical protein HOS79_gp049 [Lactobacillus phage Nyseid]|uniref:Uncharacterized protein n=1 Tax=Lactobacillus phage Nyseid TaxID=2079432 RepID=A0A2K9VC79_9CAUD|nr:hypothetical protein HOS79_gp049 [Lactobacillus phage Nyseid]AUV59809.1 hypothetical protein [Lactobacillus phage Nyseid]
MFRYKTKDGSKVVIMLSHVIYFYYSGGGDTFSVIVDDGTDEPISIPIERYDDFEIAMLRYSQTKGVK